MLLVSDMFVCGRTPQEFSRQLEKALSQDPSPMRGEDHKRLTWEDATERFLDVTEITAADRAKPLDAALDTLAYNSYNLLTGAASDMLQVAQLLSQTNKRLHGALWLCTWCLVWCT